MTFFCTCYFLAAKIIPEDYSRVKFVAFAWANAIWRYHDISCPNSNPLY